MFESCLRNYKERLGVLFLLLWHDFSHAPGRSSSQAKRAQGAERESCLRNNEVRFLSDFFCIYLRRRSSTIRAIWLGILICCGHLGRHSSQS